MTDYFKHLHSMAMTDTVNEFRNASFNMWMYRWLYVWFVCECVVVIGERVSFVSLRFINVNLSNDKCSIIFVFDLRMHWMNDWTNQCVRNIKPSLLYPFLTKHCHILSPETYWFDCICDQQYPCNIFIDFVL